MVEYIENMQITIDTLSFVKFLEEKKHFTHEQAETLVEAAVEYTNAVGKDIATKQDFAMQKKDIIIWLGSAIFLATGIIVGAMALMIGR